MPRFIPFLVLALAIVGTRVPKPVEPIRGDGRWFVDATREHLELRYGSSDDGDWDDWILVARGSARDASLPQCNSCCPMTDREDAETREVVGRRSLDYDLVELGESDPWRSPRITR